MSETFSPSSFDDHEQELLELSRLGFATNPLNKLVHSVEEAWEYASTIHSKKDELLYEIDGVVIKAKDNRVVAAGGVVGKTPRVWAAIKFAGEEAATKIIGLTWQVGRTGKVTPVADLEPTLLVGTTVKRATLHNYKEVLESDIRIGDTVVIHKAGDIIPEIKQILTNLRPPQAKHPVIPKTCPVCHTDLTLTTTGVDLQCMNESCKAQILGRLAYFTQRSIANITGLSEKTLEKFIEMYDVHDIDDLYKLPFEKIFELEGFGQKSVENLKASIKKSKTMSLVRFFAGLGIDGVGLEVAQLILNTIPELTTVHQLAKQDHLL